MRLVVDMGRLIISFANAQATESMTFDSTNTSSKYLNRKRGCYSFSVQNIADEIYREYSEDSE